MKQKTKVKGKKKSMKQNQFFEKIKKTTTTNRQISSKTDKEKSEDTNYQDKK